jgi:RNA polymerase sigma factor (sigma-70 family)
MKDTERLEIFNNVRARHLAFLSAVLWKLTGDRELFTEAMQYALLGIWQHVEKLNGKKAQSYIYRIALSANSRAWRNRIGKNGQIDPDMVETGKGPSEQADRAELVAKVRQTIAQLPDRQSKAIVMRYLEQQDYQTIAQKLGCSQEAARSHVSKAVAALKIKLAKFAGQE